MDETELLEKLRLIEALFAGATTDGERVAAAEARARIQKRLGEVERTDPPGEYRFTIGGAWSRKVFLALLRRYDLRPYRYRGQRHTTVMVRVSGRFVNETLWPELEQIAATLRPHLDEITERVVADVIHRAEIWRRDACRARRPPVWAPHGARDRCADSAHPGPDPQENREARHDGSPASPAGGPQLVSTATRR